MNHEQSYLPGRAGEDETSRGERVEPLLRQTCQKCGTGCTEKFVRHGQETK